MPRIRAAPCLALSRWRPSARSARGSRGRARPLGGGGGVAAAYRALLSRITRYAERGPGELRGQVRIAHVAAQGIREAVLETDTNLLVLEAGSGQERDGLWVNAVEDLLVD